MRLTGVEYEAAMYGRTVALLYATTLLGFAGGIARYTRGAVQVPAADRPLSHEERARLLATGKELFLARCARCHDERGDKPLKTPRQECAENDPGDVGRMKRQNAGPAIARYNPAATTVLKWATKLACGSFPLH